MKDKSHEELIQIINKQSSLIVELTNDNAEKENMIKMLFLELSSS